MNRNRLEGLELLRFLLAFAVVGYHFGWTGIADAGIPGPVLPFTELLKFGVQGFFIVSGFVIVESISTRTPAQFAIARFSRLGPTLLIASVLIAAAGPFEWQKFFASVLVLPLMHFDGMSSVMWTLRYELLFYAVVFVLALRIDVKRYAVAFAVFLIACDLIAPHAFDQGVQWRRPLLLLAPYGSWFAIGLLLHALRRGIRCHAILLAAVLVAALEARAEVPTSYGQALLMTAFLVALVYGAVRVRVSSPVFLTLGASSFPLYLLHCGLGFPLTHLFAPAGPQSSKLLSIACVTALSIFIARSIEPGMSRAYRQALRYVQAGNVSVKV